MGDSDSETEDIYVDWDFVKSNNIERPYESNVDVVEYVLLDEVINKVETYETVLTNFVQDEVDYVETLKCFYLECLASTIEDDCFMDRFELVGRIDLIYRYHAVQFLPEILQFPNVNNIVEYFFKHKMLFYMYEDFIRREPLMLLLKMDFKFMDKLFKHKDKPHDKAVQRGTILTKRLEKYISFLKQLNYFDENNNRYDVAIKLIADATTEGHRYHLKGLKVAELIVTEMRHVKGLEKNLEIFNQNVFKRTNKFNQKKKEIYGKLPELCATRKKFLKSLESCLYDFDITDVMNCLLEHKESFKLYIDDLKLKKSEIFANCAKECPELKSISDTTVDRLCKYPFFLEIYRKFENTNETTLKKIKTVEKMFSKIKDDANNVLAIEAIFDSNISLYDQGALLIKGPLKVTADCIAMTDHNKKECIVFIFEHAIIFTKKIETGNLKNLMYIHHVLTSKIEFNKSLGKDLFFTKRNSSKVEKYKLSGTAEAISVWANKLKSILINQLAQLNKTYMYLTPSEAQ